MHNTKRKSSNRCPLLQMRIPRGAPAVRSTITEDLPSVNSCIGAHLPARPRALLGGKCFQRMRRADIILLYAHHPAAMAGHFSRLANGIIIIMYDDITDDACGHNINKQCWFSCYTYCVAGSLI